MHDNSLKLMKRFVDDHVSLEGDKILDVGSGDVNGTFRQILSPAQQLHYTGLDIEAGPNVDYYPDDPDCWDALPDGSFDIIISGSAFEHMEFFWLTIKEIARVLRPGGKACIIAPARWHIHQYPVDCYRFNPDGMAALAKWSDLALLDARLVEWTGGKADCSGIFAKVTH